MTAANKPSRLRRGLNTSDENGEESNACASTFPSPRSKRNILDSAFSMFGEESLAVMWKDTSGLADTELADLGFCKIVGSDLIFRHSALQTPFGDQFPKGQDADVQAKPEYEEWVEREWKRFLGPT